MKKYQCCLQKDKTETDVEKGPGHSSEDCPDEVFTSKSPAPPTITVIPSTSTSLATPQPSPLPHNKVSPEVSTAKETKAMPTMPKSSEEIKGPTGPRGNTLPPIAPRPDAANRSINQPIRSTR